MAEEPLSWRDIWWVLAAFNWKPPRGLIPSKKSATLLLLVKAQDGSQAGERIQHWARQHEIHAEWIIETGNCAGGLPVSKRTLKDYTPILQAATTQEPTFLILISSDRKVKRSGVTVFVESHAEAVAFLRYYGLPVDPLSESETKALRAQWRRKYLKPDTHPRMRHRCGGCGSQRVRAFDWDSLKCTDPLPPLRELLANDKERIALFFERCDLPAFICKARLLREFEPDPVDLYLTPLQDCRWTIVYTHEQPYCGPYFCR